MATKNATIQLKRLTSTTLERCEVILAAGEPLIGRKEFDEKLYVVLGDGENMVKDLVAEPWGDTDGAVEADQETISGTGLADDKLAVMISAEEDNVLEKKTDGLYVNKFHDVDGGEI